MSRSSRSRFGARSNVRHSLLLAALLPPALAAQEPVEGQARDLDRITVVAEKTQVATKTDTELDEIPQAVSVVSGELARSRGADTLQDALRYTAGVTAEPYGLDPRADGFFVRGLDAQQTLDGFRRLYNYSPMPRVDVYAIDRVEVLRGPASVLYGQGTTGGLVNAVSKRPSLRDAAEMSVRFGSFDHAEVRMDMTGSLNGSDTVAARLVTVARDAELPTHDLPNNRLLVAPSLTWFLGDATRITWLGQFQRDDSASAQQFLPYAAVKGLRGEKLDDVRLFIGDRQHDRLDARQNTNTLLLEHDLGERWTLTAKARDSRAHTDFVQIYADSFTSPLDPFISDQPGRTVHRFYYRTQPNLFSQQIDAGMQREFDTGPVEHAVLFGLDYARFKQDSRGAYASSNVPENTPRYITPIDLDNPISSGVTAPPLVDDAGQRARQLGIYAQDQMRLGDRLTWVVGGRHDKVNVETEGAPEMRLSETTWRTGLVYEIAPGISPYANYSESFTPVQGVDFYGDPFDPLRGEQVEAGVKWMPSRQFALTVAAFRMEEQNRLTNDPENISNTIQTGRVRSQGGEIEALYSGGNGWTVTGAASFTDVEVLESSFDYEEGRQLNDVPRRLASLWVDKRIGLGAGALSLGAGARYVGSTTSYGENVTIQSPDYTLFDLRAEYAQGPYFARLNVNNVADRQVFAPCRALGDCFTGMPRTVMAEFGLRY
ncbi:TonB-dependent siderophore receptor [Lysobacter sp. M15]|uniref:TonB-dependent siderophore receptor n=1 Tax=Lysobacter sp. M15 TaxID=2916837 RepID=UPI001F57CDE5|nr:TonB-dependent siderophore receptor [Lysobacter sp. M15]